MKFLKPFTEKLQRLEQNNADLQTRVKDQDARLLDLEAQKYAVDHVER
jgi:hypothetical protein